MGDCPEIGTVTENHDEEKITNHNDQIELYTALAGKPEIVTAMYSRLMSLILIDNQGKVFMVPA